MSYCFGGLTNVLWYYLAPNFQVVLLFCYGLPSLVLTFCLIFLVRDTPICLISSHSPEAALKALQFMASFNGKTDFDLSINEVKDIQRNYKGGLDKMKGKVSRRFSILDLFRYRSLCMLTVFLVVMDCTLDLQYYTPTLMLSQFKFSIFINGLVIQSSQILASLLTVFVIHRFPRKRFNSFSYGVVTVCSLVLVFIWDQNK